MSGSASTNATSAPQGLYPVVVFTTVYHLQFWGPRAPSPSAIATPYAGWYYMPIPYLSMAPPMAAYMPAAAPAAAAAQSANGASSGHEASSSSASQAPPGQDTTCRNRQAAPNKKTSRYSKYANWPPRYGW